jgi:protease I
MINIPDSERKMEEVHTLQLKGKKIAVFVENFYEDMELWYPVIRFREEGALVEIIGPKVDTFRGKNGVPAKADRAISDVRTDEFHALIIPGGYSPDHMRRNADMVQFVKDMHVEGKVIAAICHAGWMLASAGFLRGKKVTSFYSIKDDMTNAGAEWVDQEVVQDGNIITSRNPHDLPAFCRTIIRALS